MVLFWCRTKQAQVRALSCQFKRFYFQIHGTSSVIHETKIGVMSTPKLTFHRIGSELGNYVRFFAAPVQAKPKFEEKDKGRPRMNEQIFAQYVRLVTDEGHGVVSRYEALERARRLNVDLVEVQPDGNPPVCKLMDYNKEMYNKQAKEKDQTKKKSDLVLRKGAMKEVRITPKIDKNDLQTKADTVKRLAERGYRIKCMAVGNADQDLGGLLSRLSALIDDFSLVESGPRIEAKQAFVVVRHVKFGPLKKGPGKKKNANASMEQSLDESGLETEEAVYPEEEIELKAESSDDFDIGENKTHDLTSKFAPETSNADKTGSENRYAATRQTNTAAPGSENRYATTRQTNASDPGLRRRFEPVGQNPISNRQFDLNRQDPRDSASSSAGSSYGMFGTRKPNNDPPRDNGPVEVNRYKKGPSSQSPPSDHYRGARGDFRRENSNVNPPSSQSPPSDHYRGARGDFRRENSNVNPGSIREKQAGFRR